LQVIELFEVVDTVSAGSGKVEIITFPSFTKFLRVICSLPEEIDVSIK
jgi:hypothetical protein